MIAVVRRLRTPCIRMNLNYREDYETPDELTID